MDPGTPVNPDPIRIQNRIQSGSRSNPDPEPDPEPDPIRIQNRIHSTGFVND